MAKGGKRVGSGRKKSTVAVASKETADKIAAAGGITMLEIMVDNARHFHKVAQEAENALKTIREQNAEKLAKMSGEEQFDLIMAEVIKAADLRKRAQASAEGAAPYLHARIAPIEPAAGKQGDVVPLAERLKAYAREHDAIVKSAGKVVDLKKRKAK